MEKPIDSDQIEQYFRGELDAEAAEQLKAAVEKDKQLREAFEWHKDMSKAVEWRAIIDEAEAERQDERGISSDEKARPPRQIFRLSARPWLAYAAGGLILIMIGSFVWGNTNYNNQKLAQVGMDRLNLKEGSDNLRNTSGTAEDPFAQGLTAIEKENWSLAADFFSTVADTSQLFIPARLYLAYSHLKGGRYERVQSSASLVEAQSADTRQRQKAQWMIVQASIAQGQDATVLNELLDSISADENHMFRREALLLKKKLASPWRVLTWQGLISEKPITPQNEKTNSSSMPSLLLHQSTAARSAIRYILLSGSIQAHQVFNHRFFRCHSGYDVIAGITLYPRYINEALSSPTGRKRRTYLPVSLQQWAI